MQPGRGYGGRPFAPAASAAIWNLPLDMVGQHVIQRSSAFRHISLHLLLVENLASYLSECTVYMNYRPKEKLRQVFVDSFLLL